MPLIPEEHAQRDKEHAGWNILTVLDGRIHEMTDHPTEKFVQIPKEPGVDDLLLLWLLPTPPKSDAPDNEITGRSMMLGKV